MSEQRVIVACNGCGKQMSILASASGVFKCIACGRKMKLAPGSVPPPAPPQPVHRPLPPAQPPMAPLPPVQTSAPSQLPSNPAYTSAGSKKNKKRKRKRSGVGARWYFGDYVVAGVLLIFLIFITIAAVVAGIPNGIAEFEAPTDGQLTTISGKPTTDGVEKWLMTRGINTVLSFSVADRDFLLEGGNWDGQEGLQPIADAIENCDELSLKVTKDDSYEHMPFWEMKADGKVIVSKQDMVDRHNFERYPALLVPIAVVVFALFAAGVGIYYFFFQKS